MRELFYNPHVRLTPMHLAAIRIVTGIWLVALFIVWHIQLRWAGRSYVFPSEGATFNDVMNAMQTNSLFFVSAVAAALLLILGIGRRIIAALLLVRVLILCYPSAWWSTEVFPESIMLLVVLTVLILVGTGDAMIILPSRRRKLATSSSAWLLAILLASSIAPFDYCRQEFWTGVKIVRDGFTDSALLGVALLPVVIFLLLGLAAMPLLLFRRTRGWGWISTVLFAAVWILLQAVLLHEPAGGEDPVIILQMAGTGVIAFFCVDPSWFKPRPVDRGKRVVFYDGYCGVCNRAVNILLAEDQHQKLYYASLQGVTAEGVLARNPQLQGVDSLVYLRRLGEPDEEVFVKSQAALLIARDIGGFCRLFALFLRLPLRVRDGFYDLIARNRYRLLKKFDTCPLPAEKDRDRFLP